MQSTSGSGPVRLKCDGFRLEASVPAAEAASLLRAVLRQRYRVMTPLKDSRPCWAARVDVEGRDLVLKVPKARNRRSWERFLTLFRPGESIRQHRSIETLRRLGQRGPDPILGAERRQAGRVVDGFFLYGFVEGRQATSRDTQAVAEALLELHGQGYLRGDPQAQNFIMEGDQARFIDFKMERPRLFPKLRLLMEYSKFLESLPFGYRYLDEATRDSRTFRLANALQAGLSCLRRWRKGAKQHLKGWHRG